MENNMQNKKSNARIAWDEFISKFSPGNDSLKPSPSLALSPDQAICCPPVTETYVCVPEQDILQDTADEVAVSPPRVTVIGENVEIDGNCTVQGDIEIYGVINGDVSAGGKISLFGKVNGNMSGANVHLSAAEVKGSIVTEGSVELDGLSTLADGKIVAKNLVSNGNTVCDMEISGIARFQSAARMTGDIRTSRISIEEGAVIKGAVISE